MNRLSIVVDDVGLVLQEYDQIKVFRSTTLAGAYVEITTSTTRITILPEDEVYYYTDSSGTSGSWYKTCYYNSGTGTESDLSSPRQGGTETEKIGYTFGNYSAPPGEWGELITPDDLRYSYMWGVDMTADDVAQSSMEDAQLRYYIMTAIGEFESYLDMDILRKVYKTNPDSELVRSRFWRDGVDYTHEDDPYDFLPEEWRNNGFVLLRHFPVISIERAVMYSQVKTEVIDLSANGWIRLNKATGQVQLFPTSGMMYGPFAVGAYPWRLIGSHYPEGFEFDYTTGYSSSDFVPEGLRAAIAKWATVLALSVIGDGLMAGFSSQSVSLDGLSESFSSTQSATSAFFGARIKQYQDEIKDWLQRNRYKFGRGPSFGFVGV